MRLLLGMGVLVAAMSLPLAATTLTFNITGAPQNEAIPQGGSALTGYGTFVNASTIGNFNYLIGSEGATPNVRVTYGPETQFTGVCSFDATSSCVYQYPATGADRFGDLSAVIAQSSRGADSGKLLVTFLADPGYTVSLQGFDVAIWQVLNVPMETINSIQILDGANNVLSAANNVVVPGDTSHLHFAPGSIVSAPVIRLAIDASNLGYPGTENTGISNIQFSQATLAQVPEASTWTLVGIGLAALGLRRFRRQRSA